MIKIVIEKSVRKHVLSTPSKLHFCRYNLVVFCPLSLLSLMLLSVLAYLLKLSKVLLKIPTLDPNELKNFRTISNQPFI